MAHYHRTTSGLLMAACAVALLALPSARAGEKIRESAPSARKPAIQSPGAPVDPILDKVLSPKGSTLDSGPQMPSIPYPNQSRPGTDPLLQKRWARELDKRRNWLLENAAQLNESPKGNDSFGPVMPDDSPRFSEPGTGIGAKGTGGDRYMRATRDQRDAQSDASAEPEDPSLTEEEREAKANGGQTREQAARTIPFGTDRSEGNTRREGDPNRSALFSEGGAFSNPVRSAISDEQRTALEERNASFSRLLSGASGASSAGLEPSNVNALGLSKTPQSRAQHFESLLIGVGNPAPSASIFGNPLSPAPAAAKPSLAIGPERDPVSSMLPVAAPSAPRAPINRLEPRPAVLQLPKFGL